MGELLPPALWGRGGEGELVSGGPLLSPAVLTLWCTKRTSAAQAPGLGRHRAPRGLRVPALQPQPTPGSGNRVCVCPIERERASARSRGLSRHPQNWDTEALPMRLRHRAAHALSSFGLARPASRDSATSRARPPYRLRALGHVRARRAPLAAPRCRDHTHRHPRPRAQKPSRHRSAVGAWWPLLPLARWL